MSPFIILLTVILYFALLFTVSYLSGRKADNAGFFTGNRKSPWYIVAFATIGAAISGVTFVSVPGMVADSGFSYMQMVLGFAVGQIIIAFVLIPLFYRMNLVSIYEYLEKRFGMSTYKMGAWIFFVSKMMGASIRLFIVCVVLQLLVFDPLNIHFVVNLIFTVGLVWLYTVKGGVKSLVWTDSLKTFSLIVTVGLSIYYITRSLDGSAWSIITSSEMSKTFFFDDLNDRRHFLKQFLAGVFTVIAITGLDQDLMQKSLSCRNSNESQKNMIVGGVLQIAVNLLFLMLGVLLYTYVRHEGIDLQALGLKPDDVFPHLATGGYFPAIVGVLFVIGLISAAYAAAGSALTALTTSFMIDILGVKKKSEDEVRQQRVKVHAMMAVIMAVVIFAINIFNDDSVIQTVYKLASYTYGPLLGIFMFGIIMNHSVKDKFVPWVAIASPVLTYIFDVNSKLWFNGYEFSHDRLILNGLFTFIGMCLLIQKQSKTIKNQRSKSLIYKP